MEEIKVVGPEAVVAYSPGLVTGDMDGEKVMLNIEKGKYFALDAIASRIWELIEGHRAVRDIVSVLVKEYEVEKEQCERDVIALLNKLYAEGLIVVD